MKQRKYTPPPQPLVDVVPGRWRNRPNSTIRVKWLQRQRSRLFWEQEGQCYFCLRDCLWVDFGQWLPGRSLYRQPMPWNVFTIEHLVPWIRTGDDSKRNLVGACKECNQVRDNARRNREVLEMACGGLWEDDRLFVTRVPKGTRFRQP